MLYVYEQLIILMYDQYILTKNKIKIYNGRERKIDYSPSLSSETSIFSINLTTVRDQIPLLVTMKSVLLTSVLWPQFTHHL